ncbi:hypothetical protein N2F28_09185 [Leuconostoc falkenbergense]|jgi:hypothetical protein|uniref:Uncharacterized protein n=2 Tax=Leuconostoc falkenbergense TaxID=2766470 RepID=A0ABT7S0H0_9LACO|nr:MULTISPECIES: hypothetical protein [Leuconostoc]MDM7646389.1 hypothetical protein [Leuconostoc falkenbergense]MDV3546572.1 hypothetical protein [Leuconostoc falkenbergense]VTU60247.1 hypothetical protein AMBR_MGDJBKAP_01781 [Leuconostoc pseudomesenteroides]
MMWRMVYWVVIVLIVLVGCYLVYRSYKYSEIELVWWDYLLYISVFVSWIMVGRITDTTGFVSLGTTLVVLCLMLMTQKKNQ